MKKSNIFAAITGNIIEWYDFTLYVFLAPIISHNFFPQQNHVSALLSTFSIFALSYFVRPLGSVIFGHLGDRYGRVAALKLTIFLISLLTISVAVLPTYQQLGFYASALLVVLRLLQGLCLGGEFAGSMIYLTEMATIDKRAITSCMANNGSNFGVLLATLVAALCSSVMSESFFYQNGWRLPFALGGIIGFLGLWFRRHIDESPIFSHLQIQNKLAKMPLLSILRSHKKKIFHVFLLLSMAASGSYALMDFMSNYLHQYFHYSLTDALKIQAIYNFLTFFIVMIAAKLSDRFGRKLSLLIAAMGYILFSIPCFYFLNIQGSWLWLLPLVIFYSIEEASMPVTIVEMFPANARYTGISIGYNAAMALIGGTAPLMNTWLIAKFNNPVLIGYFLAMSAFISLYIILTHLPKGFGLACDLYK